MSDLNGCGCTSRSGSNDDMIIWIIIAIVVILCLTNGSLFGNNNCC